MPRHLISDAHEWINEIPTVPIYYLAKPQPRERAWQQQRGEIPLLLLFFYLFGEAELDLKRPLFSIKIALLPVDPSRRNCQVGSLAGATRLSNDNAGVLR